MTSGARALDGLAWVGVKEKDRVAKLAAQLVRSDSYKLTQTEIKDAIRATVPPYGRANHIFKALHGPDGEIERQRALYELRREKHLEWERYLTFHGKVSNRRNYAYAAAFSRPPREMTRRNPHKWGWADGADHPNRLLKHAWDQAESERDKGDTCKGLTHQDGYVVALVADTNGDHSYNSRVALRLKKGPITGYYLQGRVQNLAEAALSLGGPRVVAAIAKGKRVRTDWVGSRSYIYHDGSDHETPKVEEVRWQIAIRSADDRRWINKEL